MLRQFNKVVKKNLINPMKGPSRGISTGFYRNSEELDKLKKQELPDERVNEIIRSEEAKKHEQLSSIETEEGANIHKAQKKIKKMVPKDIEKFD